MFALSLARKTSVMREESAVTPIFAAISAMSH